MSANAATSRAASLCAILFLPAVVFHDEARHGLDLFLLENKAFALVPAPGLLVLTHAAQEYLVRQMRSGEGEQPSPERAALILWHDEKLVEVTFRQMQRQHGRERAAVVGDEKAPALFDLLRDSRAQSRHIRRCGRGGSTVVASTDSSCATISRSSMSVPRRTSDQSVTRYAPANKKGG